MINLEEPAGQVSSGRPGRTEMSRSRQFIVVMLLVLGVFLVSQTVAMADSEDGISNQSAPGGSKYPSRNVPTPVPEPSTMILLGCAIAGLYGIRGKIAKGR